MFQTSEKVNCELECTEKLSDLENEQSDGVDSRKSNLEKLEEELVKEGSDGQWTVLEDIDTEALKKTVDMTKD